MRNYGDWASATYDELFDKQNLATDPDERDATLLELVKHMETEVPRSPDFVLRAVYSKQPWLHNFHAQPASLGTNAPQHIWRDK